MIIDQIFVSPCLTHFKDRVLKKYQLNNYKNTTKPSIFFGCYSETSLRMIESHKGLAVVIWGGMDAALLHTINSYMVPRLRKKNIISVAVSHWIAEDLDILKLKYVRQKFTPTSIIYPVINKGKCVYSYGIMQRPEIYNKKMVKEISSDFPDIEFITANSQDVQHQEMFDVYKRCFLGYRLTKHDGLSNTVLELGQLGIYSVHNNPDLPCTVAWNTKEDITKATLLAMNTIGKTDIDLALATRDYLEKDKFNILRVSNYR
jgi:hypothetical protein